MAWVSILKVNTVSIISVYYCDNNSAEHLNPTLKIKLSLEWLHELPFSKAYCHGKSNDHTKKPPE